jgi:hypothetical protein
MKWITSQENIMQMNNVEHTLLAIHIKLLYAQK